MYESPIELITQDLLTQMENGCVGAIQKYGFNVDKEELRKALQYDRNQYDKGFMDGRKEFAEALIEEINKAYVYFDSSNISCFGLDICKDIINKTLKIYKE